MSQPSFVPRLGLPPAVLLAAALAASPVLAQPAGAGKAEPPSARSEDGRYVITLRPLAAGGLVAEEETDIEFYVGDASRVDPVLGPAPVVRAQIRGRFIMPAMPGMPEAAAEAHVEGQPGYYGVVTSFAHGGDYLMHLVIRPPSGEPFTVQFPLKVGDAAPGGKPRPRPFTVQLETAPRAVKAGEPAELTIRIFARATPKMAVREFDLVHEQLHHLVIVSRDLGTFEHVHPVLDPATGAFTIRHTFPYGGEFRLFSDVTPRNAGMQILLSTLKVQGPTAPTAEPLRAEAAPVAKTGDYQVAVKSARGPLTARTDEMLELTYSSGGKPVTDMQPWLGALGHLLIIHEDAATMVHSHPQEPVPAAGEPTPGTLHFYARFPKPGLYRGWAQFQHLGKVQTAPFVVRVEAGK